jgi:hypothetical protein
VEGAGFGAMTRPPSIGEPESRTEMTGRTTAVAKYATRRKVTVTSRQEEDREAKAYALRCFACLVEEGLAQWRHAADGAAELRLVTGEIYRLGENTLWRIV